MISRVTAAVFALAVVLGMTTGCQPEPTPSPSGPVFANEQEAFAAAEETYRAYVDALNDRRSDPRSDPDPQSFLIGQALEVDIDTQQQLDQQGLTLVGTTSVTSIEPLAAQPNTGHVQLEVCLDSTDTRVLNDGGNDVTPADRDPISLITVGLAGTAGRLLVESSTTKRLGEC